MQGRLNHRFERFAENRAPQAKRLESEYMDKLIKRTWRHYDKFAKNEHIVKRSIPILYFGDLEAYRKSKHRIITVGLNPSMKEFPSDLQRFKISRNKTIYINSLNDYFKNKPYKWFKSYKHILSGLDASYYPNDTVSSTALHTDLCTPIATNPAWTELVKSRKDIAEDLVSEGCKIWSRLMECLKPHAIICSIAEQHLRRLNIKDKKEIHRIKNKKDGTPRKKPYIFEAYTISFNTGHTSFLFFGQAANTPFGSLSNEDKTKLGKSISKILNNKFRGSSREVRKPLS